MPLKPKVRPLGQRVILVNTVKSPRGQVPVGTICIVEGINIGEDNKVRYKIEHQKSYVWVLPTDLKKAWQEGSYY